MNSLKLLFIFGIVIPLSRAGFFSGVHGGYGNVYGGGHHEDISEVKYLGTYVGHPKIPPKIIKITKTVAVKIPVPYPVKIPHPIKVSIPIHKPYPVPVPKIIKTKEIVHVPVYNNEHDNYGSSNGGSNGAGYEGRSEGDIGIKGYEGIFGGDHFGVVNNFGSSGTDNNIIGGSSNGGNFGAHEFGGNIGGDIGGQNFGGNGDKGGYEYGGGQGEIESQQVQQHTLLIQSTGHHQGQDSSNDYNQNYSSGSSYNGYGY